jgi:glycosyltransferase involved in cell wall biosynthesis
MKLLYTSTAYPPSMGGAQLCQHLLAQKLNQRHAIQVISHWATNRTDWLLGTTLTAPNKSVDYIVDGINVHQLGFSIQERVKLIPSVIAYYPFMPRSVRHISNFLKQYIKLYASESDIIHNVRIGREGLSYASFELAREYKVPFVFTPVHHPRWVGWRYNTYIKLYQMSDAVIALTAAEKEILIKLGVLPDRIFVTGMGPVLAPDAYPQQFLATHDIDGPIVLFLGQHYTYKGYAQVLEATQEVWQKVPEAHFVFIGPPVENSEKLFASFQDHRIHRLGKVDLQTKTDALSACTLLCVPSMQESFGGVYTEAWNFEKPVIGCNIPAVAEVITHEVNGYLVEQNSHQIAEHILKLLLDPDKATQMGQQGKQKVEAHYTWDILAQKTEKIYLSLLHSRKN